VSIIMGSQSSRPKPPSHSKTRTTLKHTEKCDKSGSQLECRSQKKTNEAYGTFNIHNSKSKLSRAARQDLDSIFFE